MVHVDYIVLTIPAQRAMMYRNGCLAAVGALSAGEPRTLYGAQGVQGSAGFCGNWNDGRLVVVATGGNASVVAEALRNILSGEPNVSVARMDVQATISVDNADTWIIKAVPSSRYQAFLITPCLSRSGATLYVGAPSSNARLRMYNKSAEANLPAPGGREWLRLEVQLRNRYADRAWYWYVKGHLAEHWYEWIDRMLSDDTAKAIDMVASAGLYWRTPDVEPIEDWINRRKRWYETMVLPGLRKLLAADPGYASFVVSSIQDQVAKQEGEE